ncbi:MAG: hypothetical protein HYR71_13825, partial [Chloroflexi bacterium]|nr:hypothetical protein [Chloroflexota bacterium]
MTVHLAGASLRQLASPARRRWVWRLLTLFSLMLAGIGLVYAWREFPTTSLTLSPIYLWLALAIYGVTYTLHLLGWHRLSRQFLGDFVLGDDAEAVAGSSFVKYLPTVGWYIANRANYYGLRHVSERLVVVASLYEIGAMIASGSTLYVVGMIAGPVWAGALVGLLAVVATVWSLRATSSNRPRTELPAAIAPRGLAGKRDLIIALIWYGSTWPLGVWFLWALLNIFIPLRLDDWAILFPAWLLAGLASYVMSITLGSVG